MAATDVQGTCFDPGIQAELVDRSRQFAYNFLNGEGEANLDAMDENVVLVGPAAAKSVYDRDEYLHDARRIEEDDVRVVLTNQTLTAFPIREDYCCVIALFRLFLSIGSGPVKYRGVLVRYSFHWHVDGDEMKILSIESSYDRPMPDGSDWTAPSETAAEPRPLDRLVGDRLLEFRDDRRVSHFVGVETVLYVEAKGHKSVVHCDDDVFMVNEGISAVEDRLGSSFVRLHRSYLVNPRRVRTLSDKGATLDDGESLPVPTRRVEELRRLLGSANRRRSELEEISDILFND